MTKDTVQPNMISVSALPPEIKQFIAQVYEKGFAAGRKAAKPDRNARRFAYVCGTHFLSVGGTTPGTIRTTYERLAAVLTPEHGFAPSFRECLDTAHRILTETGDGSTEGMTA